MVRALVALALVLVSLPAQAGRGTALIKYAADDANAIAIVDVARSRRSPLFKKTLELIRSKRSDLDTLAQKVELDKAIDTLVLVGNTERTDVVAVIEGRIDKLVAEVKKQATKEEKHAGVTFWVLPDGAYAVIDKKLVSTTVEEIPNVIDRAANKKAKGPASLRTIVANATPNSGFFAGLVPDAAARKDMGLQLGSEPQWVAVSFGMAQRLTVEGKLKFNDDAAAEKVTRSLNDKLGAPGSDGTVRSQLEGFVGKDFSDSIVVDQDHTFARVSATMTGDEVDKVLALVRMFM
jgi:hypothetical protein